MSLKKIAERWRDQISKTSDIANDILRITNSFKCSPFEDVDHRIDLRGLPVVGKLDGDGPLASPMNTELRDLLVRNVDFSRATFQRVFFYSCQFENCKFDQSTLNDITFSDGCEMNGCSFTGASVEQFNCIEIDFLRCTFEKTKWKGRYNFFRKIRIVECAFEGPLKSIDFGGAIIEDTRFKGLLHEVKFHGWRSYNGQHPRLVRHGDSTEWLETPFEMVPQKMKGVDFSEADLRMTELTDYCYLQQAVLPPITSHCVFEQSVAMLEALKKEITKAFAKGDQDNVLRYVGVFYAPHPTQPHAICNIADLSERLGTENGHRLYEIIVSTSERIGTRVFGERTK
jgi:uncharacterized protein YjbI with pentapeptide repeats